MDRKSDILFSANCELLKGIGSCYQTTSLVYIYAGKCIEAEPIEKKFVTSMPAGTVQDCVLLGEGMDRLLLLVSFKAVSDTEQLHPVVTTWLKKIGSNATTAGDLTDYKDKSVRNEILVVIAKVRI